MFKALMSKQHSCVCRGSGPDKVGKKGLNLPPL